MMNLRKAKSLITDRVSAALGGNFSAAELESIVRFGTHIEVCTGRSLTVENTRGREAFVIVSGNAAVVQHNETIAILGAGDVVGEGALVTGLPRNADVVAIADVCAFVFAAREFSSLMSHCPQLHARVHQLAATREQACTAVRS